MIKTCPKSWSAGLAMSRVWCGRPSGHEGICWPVPFESDKSSEETT